MNTSRLILVLWTSCSLSYAQWRDDFSSGSLLQPHVWQGTSTFFNINVAQQLQSNGPTASSTLFLQTTHPTLNEAVWECWLKMDFESSAANYTKIILTASSSDFLDPNLEAYYVKVGGLSGTADGIDLYYQKGASHTRLIKGIEGRAGGLTVELRVKISRDEQGNWMLSSDDRGGVNFQLEGKAHHQASFSGQFFGFLCIHSATRRDKFYFDDVMIDNDPFFTSDVQVVDPRTLLLSFNQPLGNDVSKDHFLLDEKPLGAQDVLEVLGQKVIVHLQNPLFQGQHSLWLPNLLNHEGKVLSNAGSIDFFYIRPIGSSDLFITEIMADPSPSIGLPDVEYVELHNATEDTLWLQNVRLGDPATNVFFPAYDLKPKQRLILCPSAEVSQWHGYGEVLGISPWPSLNNDKDTLFLWNASGALIDRVVYNTSVLSNVAKRAGGWAMELIHEREHCKGFLNWNYSEHVEGGTPGAMNAVSHYPLDDDAPQILSQHISKDLKRFDVHWNEPIDTSVLPMVKRLDSEERMLGVVFERDQTLGLPLMVELGNAVSVEIRGVRDCVGNSTTYAIELQNPKPAAPGEVKINEVLFNPYPYGTDFIELYNATDLFLTLDSASVENKEGSSCTLKNVIMAPRAYLVLSSDSMEVKQFYPAAAWGTFAKALLPVFADLSGEVLLRNKEGGLLDHMHYTESMHHPFLESKEGFSLERVGTEQASDALGNWISASLNVHGATPGYRNSQSGETSHEGDVFIVPQTISPGTDGYRNYAHIYYKTTKPGTSVRADIYSLQGTWIRALQPAGPADVEGMCTWDGTDELHQAVSTGLYLLILDFSHPEGDHYTLKGTIGVLAP